jgi:hypothetical protein
MEKQEWIYVGTMSKGRQGIIGRFMGHFTFEPAIKKIIMEVRFKKLGGKAPADYKKTF